MSYALNHPEEFIRLEKQAKMKAYNFLEELKFFNFEGNEKILDLGCGSGLCARNILNKYPEINIDACDYNELRLKQAQKIPENKGINFYLHNIEREELKEKYDVIFARYVFHHLENPLEALKKTFNALNSGGRLYIIDFEGIFFNFFTPNNKLNSLLEKIRLNFMHDYYVGKKLPSYMQEVGFTNLDWKAEFQDCLKNKEFIDDEIQMNKERLKHASDYLNEVLGDESKYFIENYIKEMSNPSSTLTRNKYFVKGVRA
jgi:ubiquinone/menaquinone biosynthesis C-methylase UbiE